MMADKIDFGTSGYVLGIMSIILGVLQPLAGLVVGIIGLNLSKKEKTELANRGKKLNKIGIVIGVIMLIVFITIAVIASVYEFGNLANFPVG